MKTNAITDVDVVVTQETNAKLLSAADVIILPAGDMETETAVLFSGLSFFCFSAETAAELAVAVPAVLIAAVTTAAGLSLSFCSCAADVVICPANCIKNERQRFISSALLFVSLLSFAVFSLLTLFSFSGIPNPPHKRNFHQ